MNGKILKISSNDLYGNVDDRMVAVFAAFNHKRYMNKYVIFTYEGEFNKKKLYYGSLHLKDKSIVVFSVNEATKGFIDNFIEAYLTDSVNPSEYELVDISNMEKIEIVSCNERDFDALETLDQKSIKREIKNEEETPKAKRVFLYILLIIMLALLGGITYLYLFPEKFTTEYEQLECNSERYNEELNMPYHSFKLYKFDKSDLIKSTNVVETYTFSNSSDYFDFKDNHKEVELFHINGNYEYDDNYLTIKLIVSSVKLLFNK